MKIFIIGPEGAGKTVFATMLNEYVGQHTETGLTFRTTDIKTKKYLTKELDLLGKGDWPASTTGGKMISLDWQWEINGKISNINLIDPAGQDIRRELCGESNTLQIVDNIKGADLLILLVDLFGHQKENQEKRIENGWIIQHVLANLTPQQNVIFAVTKADMLTGTLPRDQWGDRTSVLKLVADMMPEFELPGYRFRLDSPNCSVLAFSSVATTENRTQGGLLLRFPKSPLASEGMGMVVQAVLTAWEEKDKRDKEIAAAKIKADQERKRADELARLAKIAGGIAAAMVVVFMLFGWVSGLQPIRCPDCNGGTITYSVICGNCGGDGKINDDDWIPFNTKPCPNCRDGVTTASKECPKCLGRGYIHK